MSPIKSGIANKVSPEEDFEILTESDHHVRAIAETEMRQVNQQQYRNYSSELKSN